MKRVYLYQNSYIKIEPSPLSFRERLKLIMKECPPHRNGLWYTPEEIDLMLEEGNDFIKNMIELGEKIYEEA